MQDDEITKNILDLYQKNPTTLQISSARDMDIAKAAVNFAVGLMRNQPSIPKGLDISVDSFTIMQFIIHHVRGSVQVNAKSITSPKRGDDGVREDISVLKYYLDTVSSRLPDDISTTTH